MDLMELLKNVSYMIEWGMMHHTLMRVALGK